MEILLEKRQRRGLLDDSMSCEFGGETVVVSPVTVSWGASDDLTFYWKDRKQIMGLAQGRGFIEYGCIRIRFKCMNRRTSKNSDKTIRNEMARWSEVSDWNSNANTVPGDSAPCIWKRLLVSGFFFTGVLGNVACKIIHIFEWQDIQKCEVTARKMHAVLAYTSRDWVQEREHTSVLWLSRTVSEFHTLF